MNNLEVTIDGVVYEKHESSIGCIGCHFECGMFGCKIEIDKAKCISEDYETAWILKPKTNLSPKSDRVVTGGAAHTEPGQALFFVIYETECTEWVQRHTKELTACEVESMKADHRYTIIKVVEL